MRRPLCCFALAAVLPALLGPEVAADENEVTRYVRFRAGEQVAYGVVEGDQVRRLAGEFGQWEPTDETYELSDVKLLVPSEPSKVLAVAINYKSHAEEEPPPSQVQIFYKTPSCLIAPGEPIVLPGHSDRVDYEAEMVIVIGKRAVDVPVEEAPDHVLGVTCGNDVSARDWQQKDIQWWRAKGSDTFGPCGPAIVSGIDYDDVLLQLRLNGEVKQSQRTSDMVHAAAEIVSFASRHVTLEPGDLIFTGTPGKTSPLQPGDRVEVELEGVGVLCNPVEAE